MKLGMFLSIGIAPARIGNSRYDTDLFVQKYIKLITSNLLAHTDHLFPTFDE